MKMKIGIWLDKVGDNFTKAMLRYPLTFATLLALCFYLSSTIDGRGEMNEAVFTGLLFAALGTILFYHLTELLAYGGAKKQLLAMLGLAFGLLYYWLYEHVLIDDTDWKGIVFGVVTFCILLCYLLMPFIKKHDNSLLQRYFVQFFENYGESLALSLILYLVLIGAISAIDMLFDIGINNVNLYSHLAIWIGGLFMPFNFLSNTPVLPVTEEELPKYDSRFFKILILYIGIPVALIYGSIILAYVVKFVMTGQTKEWRLSIFVWFLALGLVVYIMNKVFVRDNKNEVSILFDRYFPYLGMVLSISSLLICYTSIHNIGLTTSYYFAAMFSLIVLLIFCMMSFWSSMDYRIIYGIMALAGIFAIVAGPWDCYEAPMRSQSKRLLSFLESNDRYGKDGFQRSTKPVDQEKLANITSGMNQLSLETFDKMIRVQDKGHFLIDTLEINPYDFMTKLGVEYTSNANRTRPLTYKNQNQEILPTIKFDGGDAYIPVINAYNDVPNNFNGARITFEGGFHLYANGKVIDSIGITSNQINSQKISVRSLAGNQPYDIYIQNLGYENDGPKVLFRDFMGILIKKNGLK